MVQCNLKVDKQCCKAANEANGNLGMIKRGFKNRSKDIMLPLYKKWILIRTCSISSLQPWLGFSFFCFHSLDFLLWIWTNFYLDCRFRLFDFFTSVVFDWLVDFFAFLYCFIELFFPLTSFFGIKHNLIFFLCELVESWLTYFLWIGWVLPDLFFMNRLSLGSWLISFLWICWVLAGLFLVNWLSLSWALFCKLVVLADLFSVNWLSLGWPLFWELVSLGWPLFCELVESFLGSFL